MGTKATSCLDLLREEKGLQMRLREEALIREIQEQMGWNSDKMAIDDILKVEVGNQEVIVQRK